MVDENKIGTFMVRRSEQSPNLYSLSIKCETPSKGIHAKHYRTRYDELNKFCLFPGVRFETLPELIDHYKSKSKDILIIFKKEPNYVNLNLKKRTRSHHREPPSSIHVQNRFPNSGTWHLN